MTYAISDLHGNYKVWRNILNHLNEDDILFFLGDATDRGPDGWKILKEALNHKQVIYIKGNHDMMILDRINGEPDASYIHLCNGGAATWKDMMSDDHEIIGDTLMKLQDCLFYAIYTNKDGKIIFMSHSGSTETYDEYSMVWDRNCLFDDVPEDYDYIVHGHTSIPHIFDILKECRSFLPVDQWLTDYIDGAFFYAKDRKRIDIDNLTIISNAAILFNLDTFESIVVGEDEYV